jgi:hypothetical protein
MRIPVRVPYLRAATLLWGVYALVWLSLEGHVGRDALLAGWGLALAALWLIGRALGGRVLPVGRLVGLGATAGLAWGAALGPAVLLLMAFKTGLHGHGPEYTAAQLAGVWAQWPLWSVAGLAAGAGLALVAAALRRNG